jgi:hypothetical protein
MILQELQERLEASRSFQYWSKAIGLTYGDFRVYDLAKKEELQRGSKKIGEYCIFLKNDEVDSVYYDLDNDRVSRHSLERLKGKA